MSRFSISKLFLFRLAIKTIAAILLLLIAAALLYAAFHTARNSGKRSLADDISYCDYNYYERNYAGLYGSLALYGQFSEEFDKYWEAIDAYRAYTAAVEWQTALDNGREGAKEKYDQAIEELKTIEKNAQFSENRAIINGYLKEFE